MLEGVVSHNTSFSYFTLYSRDLILEKSCRLDFGQTFRTIRGGPHLGRGVLRGSVVEYLTRNQGVLGSSSTGSTGFFRGSVLGQDTSEPQPSAGETQDDMNNVSCRRDMTEILLKAA